MVDDIIQKLRLWSTVDTETSGIIMYEIYRTNTALDSAWNRTSNEICGKETLFADVNLNQRSFCL